MSSNAATKKLAAPLRLPSTAPPPLRVRKVATLQGHKDRVWCVRWCPTAAVLASCSGDATVRFWRRRHDGTGGSEVGGAGAGVGGGGEADTEEWVCVGTLEGEHSRTIRHISWSPSGEYIACASFDHTATVWRRDADGDDFSFEIEGVLDGHESEVKCVEWATDSMLLTSSRDHTAWIWERVDDGEYECGGVLTGHVQDVKHCQFLLPANDHDVPLAITCGYDNTVKIWSEGHHQDDWQCTQTLTAHEATVWATAVQKLELPMEEVRAAQAAQALLPQPLLCTCSDDLSIIFWKRNGEGRFVEVCRMSGFAERSLFDLDWAPHNSAVVACASGDNSFALLGVYGTSGAAEQECSDDGVHVCTVARVAEAHLSDVNTVAFANQGSLCCGKTDTSSSGNDNNGGVLLATGGDDRIIHLWRVDADAA